MESGSIEQVGCPWFHQYSNAAFASSVMVGLLDNLSLFSSSHLKRIFLIRSAFAFEYSKDTPRNSLGSYEGKLISALLLKYAQRGAPAPCSLLVERHILKNAADARALQFNECAEKGAFKFQYNPEINGLENMLQAALFQELLVDDDALNRLFENYQTLCTPSEWAFFEQILATLPDKRLGLFILPQREMRTLLGVCEHPADRVDFAIELPSVKKNQWLKLILELDDDSHKEKTHQDAERDKALESKGWIVYRFNLKEPQQWIPLIQEIKNKILETISEPVLQAAVDLRNLPNQQRQAITSLVTLPIAEAQLTTAIAFLIRKNAQTRLKIADPQHLGLEIVVQSISETMKAFFHLHGISSLQLPEFVGQDTEKADIVFYGSPSMDAWDSLKKAKSFVILPTVSQKSYKEPLFPAKPRHVDFSSLQRSEEVRNSLEFFLQNIFRKVSFREGQIAIIERALTLSPVVGLLPTAAGKSLCYQLVSFMQPGYTLIIDPLRSLIQDQQESLEIMGTHRVIGIMSGKEATEAEDRRSREESYQAIRRGEYQFVFIAPERLQIPEFRRHISAMAVDVPINYCVIDEAHCVSEWGHDFRPSYLNVGRIVRDYCTHEGLQPSLIALTGTASKNVITDITIELEIDDPNAVIEPKSFDRKELQYQVLKVDSHDRISTLESVLKSILAEHGWRPGQPGYTPSGLIFTYFVDYGDVALTSISEALRKDLYLPVNLFAGSAPKKFKIPRLAWEQQKQETQRQFKQDQVSIIVCTHAFGMGIDKPNIRFTIHAMLPRSLEEFYQQAGRAGRDGESARCIIIFSDDQPTLADELLDTEKTEIEKIAEKASAIRMNSRGDAIRDTWFLTNSFKGRDLEKKVLNHVLTHLIAPNMPKSDADIQDVPLPFTVLPDSLCTSDLTKKVNSEEKQTVLEKSIYRLFLIGAIADYMKDYSNKRFEVTLKKRSPSDIKNKLHVYLARYNTEKQIQLYLPKEQSDTYVDAARACGYALIDFVYETIAKRRRRVIGQMLQTARDAAENGPDVFRQQLLDYLEESEYTAPVVEFSKRDNPDLWFEVLSRVNGLDGISKLLGACRRQLEESPEHPGLLLLAGLCRLASPSAHQAEQDIRNGFLALKKNYSGKGERSQIIKKYIAETERLCPTKVDVVLKVLLEADSSPEIVHFTYSRAEPWSEVHQIALTQVMNEILDSIRGKGESL
ncbi:MAG: RecQ family ATP-dependent DNA helicase [Methanoregula sp.]|nr:RecQ family ATP-dependent DNA helicase [Methanoregula sp.]